MQLGNRLLNVDVSKMMKRDSKRAPVLRGVYPYSLIINVKVAAILKEAEKKINIWNIIAENDLWEKKLGKIKK